MATVVDRPGESWGTSRMSVTNKNGILLLVRRVCFLLQFDYWGEGRLG